MRRELHQLFPTIPRGMLTAMLEKHSGQFGHAKRELGLAFIEQVERPRTWRSAIDRVSSWLHLHMSITASAATLPVRDSPAEWAWRAARQRAKRIPIDTPLDAAHDLTPLPTPPPRAPPTLPAKSPHRPTPHRVAPHRPPPRPTVKRGALAALEDKEAAEARAVAAEARADAAEARAEAAASALAAASAWAYSVTVSEPAASMGDTDGMIRASSPVHSRKAPMLPQAGSIAALASGAALGGDAVIAGSPTPRRPAPMLGNIRRDP